MEFGAALQEVMGGESVRRVGWHGKDQYVFLLRADGRVALGMRVLDCLAVRTVDGCIQPGWVASQVEMLAHDWEVV